MLYASSPWLLGPRCASRMGIGMSHEPLGRLLFRAALGSRVTIPISGRMEVVVVVHVVMIHKDLRRKIGFQEQKGAPCQSARRFPQSKATMTGADRS